MQDILTLLAFLCIPPLFIIGFTAPQIYDFIESKLAARKKLRTNILKTNRLVQVKLLTSSKEIEDFLKENLDSLSDKNFKLLIDKFKELKIDEVIYNDINHK